MIRFCLIVFVLITFLISGFAQSSILLRNNTWNDFTLTVSQYGTHSMDTTEWSLLEDEQFWWEEDDEIFMTDRDITAIPDGDTIYFDVVLASTSDAVTLKLRLIGTAGTSNLDYSVSAPGVVDIWYSDGNFHEVQTTIAGKSVRIKYRPENDDANQSRDILFAIHDDPIYEIDSTDFFDANIINVMAYNIQMLPFGVVGLPQPNERGDLLPAEISPWQDVVIFSEVFDNAPRTDHVEPAMAAAGFPYKTSILNDGVFPWNGGVMIFSRWPIEVSDEYDFELCGQAAQDCLANKGIKYAKVNKLGKRYHIFGTHMDAGGGTDDIEARRLQMAEMRDFIAAQQIPETEAAIYGGDFNYSPLGSDFLHALDSLNPIIPHEIGFTSSSGSQAFGSIIDHVWGDPRYLLPLECTNEVITMRSIHEDLWELSDFSDHRCALGRFVYPDVLTTTGDTALCPLADINLEAPDNSLFTYQWLKDGQVILGEIASSLSLNQVTVSDDAVYQCEVSYQIVYGNIADSLTLLFYPFGPDTFSNSYMVDVSDLNVDPSACGVGIADQDPESFDIYPIPNLGTFWVDQKSAGISELRIYDVNGSNVYVQSLNSNKNKIELKGLPNGLYIAEIKSSSSEASAKRTILINK